MYFINFLQTSITALIIYESSSLVEGQVSPQLQIKPTGERMVKPVGGNVVFMCEIAGLGPELINTNLQWFDGSGREITETAGGGRLIYVEKDEYSPTKKLYFNSIRPQDEGTYTCRGVVEGNQQSDSIVLQVFQPIKFEDAQSPQHPVIYTAGRVMCRVSGVPTPTVSWRYRGVKLTTRGRYAQDQFGLLINNITKQDDGIYTCRAEVSSAGRLEERDIEVIVYIPPKIQQGDRNYVGIQSQQFVISCKATGLPAPKFIFTKDGNENPLYSTERVQIDVDSGDISFRPLHKEDEGTYQCQAYNDVDTDYGTIKLSVIE